MNIKSWSSSIIDSYRELENISGWLQCKKCNQYPRVWSFNNGLFAKCLCCHIYDPAKVRAESIGSVLSRTRSFKKFSKKTLMFKWNYFVTTGIIGNKLKKGRW